MTRNKLALVIAVVGAIWIPIGAYAQEAGAGPAVIETDPGFASRAPHRRHHVEGFVRPSIESDFLLGDKPINPRKRSGLILAANEDGPWIIQATVTYIYKKDGEGIIKLPTQAECEGFLASGDSEFTEATNSLVDDGGKVVVRCVLDPSR